jgi:sulfate transporter 4
VLPADVQHVHERLRKYVARARAYSEAAGVPLQYLLLDMSPVTHLDSTGAHLLEKLHAELVSQGVQLGLCNPGGRGGCHSSGAAGLHVCARRAT